MGDQPVIGQLQAGTAASSVEWAAERAAAANRAVAEARHGNRHDAVEAYGRALSDLRGEGVPAFLHLAMLEPAGPDVVRAFRDTALRFGADVSRAYALPGTPPEQALAEYRALFDAGIANARMLTHYARLLSVAGRSQELQALTDLDRLLAVARPDVRTADGRPLHRALNDWFMDRLAAVEPLSTRLAAVGTRRLPLADGATTPELRLLESVIRQAVQAYAGTCAALASGHPLHRWVPGRFGLEMYAHHSDGTGHHQPHTHSRGWITGVYYIACDFGPDSTPTDGALHFCPGLDGDPACPGWPDRVMPVTAGMLVLFPSHVTHYTKPLGRPSHRLVLAFDVVDARGDDGDRTHDAR